MGSMFEDEDTCSRPCAFFAFVLAWASSAVLSLIALVLCVDTSPEAPEESGRVTFAIIVSFVCAFICVAIGIFTAAMKQGVLGLVSRTIEYLAAACLGALIVGLAIGGDSDAYDVAPRGVAIGAAAVSFVCAFSTVTMSFLAMSSEDGLLT